MNELIIKIVSFLLNIIIFYIKLKKIEHLFSLLLSEESLLLNFSFDTKY